MSEQVNHPQHYGGEDNPYEAIKVVEAWNLGFCLGNVVKYISRAGKKGAGKVLEDLRKSRWYLDREIQKLEADAAALTEPPPNLNSMSAIRKHFGFPDPLEFHSILIGGCADNGMDPLYCTDLNKVKPPILTAHDPEETLDANKSLWPDYLKEYFAAKGPGTEEAGATNRLKPVEDKAEIVWPTREEVQEHFSPETFQAEMEAKWLEDAYDEPLIRHTTEDSILAGLEKLKETAEDKKRKDEAFKYNFRNRHGAY